MNLTILRPALVHPPHDPTGLHWHQNHRRPPPMPLKMPPHQRNRPLRRARKPRPDHVAPPAEARRQETLEPAPRALDDRAAPETQRVVDEEPVVLLAPDAC